MDSSLTSRQMLSAPDLTRDLERLRSQGIDRFLYIALILWMLYLVSGFRLPTEAISVSDENASGAIRQLLFAGTGMLALARLILTRTLGPVLVTRWPYILLASLVVFSVLWSNLPSLTIKRSIIFLCGLISLLTIVHSTKQPARLMLSTIVYFCGAVSFISLLFYVVLPEAHTVNPGRPGLAGISNHPNTLAPFLSIGLLLSLGLQERSRNRIIFLRGVQVILGLGLVLTFSITTWVTTLIGIVLYIFLSASRYKQGSLQLLAFAAILLVAIIGIQTLKSAFFDATGRDESLSGRDELWQVTWNEAKKYPIIGNGFGAFWTEGKGRDLVQTWNPRQSHHAYLDVLLDLGIIGLTTVLILFPLNLLLAWIDKSGQPGTQRRNAMAAMMAVTFAYMSSYAFSQSFFLKFDIFPFFILVWVTLLFTNKDQNQLLKEFPDEEPI